jgi:DNA polymerase-3 subunit alpha
MGKKDAAKMQAQRDRFLSGCRERGIPEKKAAKIFEYMEYFAGYGFPKAHSTTYALLAYQTAYLKANYPRHFMAALLTIESQSSDKVALYLAECRELGVPVLPPDINESQWQFVVQPGGVRFGLGAVKGAGEGAIRSILETRKTLGGTIRSLFLLAEHVDLRLVNKKVLESLIKAGAFDALAPDGRESYLAWRPRLLAGLDRVLDHGSRHQKDRDQGQELLFGGDPDHASQIDDAAALPVVAPLSETEALAFEKEALGLYMSGHPLQRYLPALAAAGGRRLADLTQSEADVAVGGVIVAVRQLKTKRGDRMAAFNLEDEAAKVEAVVFPEAFAKYGAQVVDDALVLVRGKYERDEDTGRLVVSEITPLDVVRERAVRGVEIRLPASPVARDVMRRVAELLDRYPGDRRVSFVVEVNGAGPKLRIRASTARRIKPSDSFVKAVEAVCGSGSVSLK